MFEWNCPHCTRTVNEANDAVRNVAIQSHLKSHDPARPSSGRISGHEGRGWGDAIGDTLSGLLGGIAKLFD